MKSLPIVAIVGQPNVGKSTLLNKIAGQSLAITSGVAGTTRDRQYVETEWNQKTFLLVDTAGLSLADNSELENSLRQQIDIALAEADAVLLVVDGKAGASAIDRDTLLKFRKIKKPLLLAINKLDAAKDFQEKIQEFRRLGIKKLFPVSAINGRGIGDLLDSLAEELTSGRHKTGEEQSQEQPIAVSLIGKPNVGKSSLFNAILKENRVVVSPIPGTTRAAIDEQLTIDGQAYTFIDTAGLKKKEYRQEQPDIYAGFQTFKAIRRSDVCLFMINSVEEVTKQDQRVASEIFNMQKGCVIIANKMDLYSGDEEKLKDYISLHFPFLWMCPVFFVSAKTGQGLDQAITAVRPIFDRRKKTVDSDTLRDFLSKKLKTNPPKLLRDQKKPKVFSLRQVDVNPPTFELTVNHPAAISQQFRKSVENSIIKDLDFWGTPISMRLKGKDKA